MCNLEKTAQFSHKRTTHNRLWQTVLNDLRSWSYIKVFVSRNVGVCSYHLLVSNGCHFNNFKINRASDSLQRLYLMLLLTRPPTNSHLEGIIHFNWEKDWLIVFSIYVWNSRVFINNNQSTNDLFLLTEKLLTKFQYLNRPPLVTLYVTTVNVLLKPNLIKCDMFSFSLKYI